MTNYGKDGREKAAKATRRERQIAKALADSTAPGGESSSLHASKDKPVGQKQIDVLE
jgi:hypothetical protein